MHPQFDGPAADPVMANSTTAMAGLNTATTTTMQGANATSPNGTAIINGTTLLGGNATSNSTSPIEEPDVSSFDDSLIGSLRDGATRLGNRVIDWFSDTVGGFFG
jgi:hypothetical protein